MSATQLTSILPDVACGVIEASGLARLEELSSDQVEAGLAQQFPVVFLEVRQGAKYEFGRAQKKQGESFLHCLFITSERRKITTVAQITSLRVRPPSRSRNNYEFKAGAGYSLYRDVDGWKVKLLSERLTTLSKSLVEKRGWKIG
jgi:hypothetical protein